MQIDLNSDLGESFGAWSMGNDAAMLDTRANRAAFLRKPFTPAALAHAVREAIDAAQKVPALPLR